MSRIGSAIKATMAMALAAVSLSGTHQVLPSLLAAPAAPWAPLRSKSKRMSAAAQKRASVKARNRARNKAHH